MKGRAKTVEEDTYLHRIGPVVAAVDLLVRHSELPSEDASSLERRGRWLSQMKSYRRAADGDAEGPLDVVLELSSLQGCVYVPILFDYPAQHLPGDLGTAAFGTDRCGSWRYRTSPGNGSRWPKGSLHDPEGGLRLPGRGTHR